MKVGNQFRFPNYQKLMWYAAHAFLEKCDMLQQRETNGGNVSGVGEDHNTDQRNMPLICSAYAPHILKGYKALANQLERWAKSKAKLTVEQYPENMDVIFVSRRLGEVMKQCADCMDEKAKALCDVKA